MEKTWASGALELLQHADSHIKNDTAFDSRIAFISIDNSVETSIRTFMSLPEKISGIKFQRKELYEAGNSFPKMVDLVFDRAKSKILGLNCGDIEHYHRIRNPLYHNGTGLGVDRRYLNAYRQIAAVLLNNLFGVKVNLEEPKGNLESLIILFNEVEILIQNMFKNSNINAGNTFKWEVARQNGILDMEDILQITELRMIRNTQVHSKAENINEEKIAIGIKIAQNLIEKLRV